MPLTRIYLPLISFLVAVAVLIVAAMLPFIPSWARFQWCSMGLATLGLLATEAWLMRGVWVQTRQQMRIAFRMVLMVAIAAAVIMSLVGVLLCFMWSNNGPLRPQYVRQFEFPEYETTIYVYEPSRSDFGPFFKIKRGWLPLNDFLISREPEIGGWIREESMQMIQSGEWAIGDGFKVYLPTGRLEVLND